MIQLGEIAHIKGTYLERASGEFVALKQRIILKQIFSNM